MANETSVHGRTVEVLTDWLVEEFGFGRVRPQSHIEIAGKAVPADVVVHDGLSREFWGLYPKGADVSLVADVKAEPAKAELFASAGVREYWVLDAAAGLIAVHRKPVDGRYTEVAKTESASPEVRPEARLILSELLPS